MTPLYDVLWRVGVADSERLVTDDHVIAHFRRVINRHSQNWAALLRRDANAVGNTGLSPNASVSRERNGARSLSRDPPVGKRYTSSGRGGLGKHLFTGLSNV